MLNVPTSMKEEELQDEVDAHRASLERFVMGTPPEEGESPRPTGRLFGVGVVCGIAASLATRRLSRTA